VSFVVIFSANKMLPALPLENCNHVGGETYPAHLQLLPAAFPVALFLEFTATNYRHLKNKIQGSISP